MEKENKGRELELQPLDPNLPPFKYTEYLHQRWVEVPISLAMGAITGVITAVMLNKMGIDIRGTELMALATGTGAATLSSLICK